MITDIVCLAIAPEWVTSGPYEETTALPGIRGPSQSDSLVSNNAIFDGLDVESGSALSGPDFEFDLRQIREQLSAQSSVASSVCSGEDLLWETDSFSHPDFTDPFGDFCLRPLPTSSELTCDLSSGEGELNSTLNAATDMNSAYLTTLRARLSQQQQELDYNSRMEALSLDNLAEMWRTATTSDHQWRIAQHLTDIMSTQLGLREQLEVLRIIDPWSTVDTRATEFVIDINDLTYDKINQVREFIQEHRNNRANSREKSRSYISRSGRKTAVDDSCSDCCATPPSKKKRSRESAKQRKQQRRLERQQRKLQQKLGQQKNQRGYRQGNREVRSGLFESEEVVPLNMNDSDYHYESGDELDICS